jgi:hypothetical protein
VAATEATVEACEASVPSAVKPATMKSAKSSVKSTTAMETATAVESATAVKTPAPAMRPGISEV